MYDLPQNTLYGILNNPLLNKYVFKQIHYKDIVKEQKKLQSLKSNPTPEEEALLFYMSNHGFHLIKSKYKEFEPLPDEVNKLVRKHINLTNKIAQRLFHYIIIISIEEGRFLPQQKDHFYDHMTNSFGPEFGSFIKNWKDNNINLSIGEFLRGLRSVFDFGKWNSGFGGRPWGNIVGLAASVCNGRDSFEMMTDQAFSLCHNNGSMFNKGHLYKCYTQFIYEILDIQASGQIPNWINENKKSNFVTKEIIEMHNAYAALFPNEFCSPLDKQKVKNSGDVRRKNEEKKMKILKSNASSNYYGNNDPQTKVVDTNTKLDNILIGDYQKNKWI